MAINDLLSENSSPVGMSPRISFSHDLSQSDIFNFPVEQRLLRSISSSSSVDFDFCINRSFNQESASAEELFSNGKILPTQVSKEDYRPPALPPAPPHDLLIGAVDSTKNSAVDSGKNNSKNENESNETTTGSEKQKSSKSFWQFKRSSSLNCGNGYARSLCPLPPLLRSNSTGSSSSSSSSKRSSSSSKDGLIHKQHSQKTPLVAPIKHSHQFSSSNSYQKPPIKKSTAYGSSHGNGNGNGSVRINPVLNVPSVNLFGLGSIFSSSNKEMKNKKK